MEISSWNSREFLDQFNSVMDNVKRGVPGAYRQIRHLRVMEYANTRELVVQGWYVTEAGNKVVIESDEMMSGTTYYDCEFSVADVPPLAVETIIKVQNQDCLLAGKELLEQGLNPAVLNMASASNPGGGVMNGAGA